MKQHLKYFILMILLCLCSCKTHKVIIENTNNTTYEYSSMKYTLNRVFTVIQVDSMIHADNLSPLKKWIKSEISYQGKVTKQYMFIKSLEKDNELIYTVTDLNNNTYKCTKRITEDK